MGSFFLRGSVPRDTKRSEVLLGKKQQWFFGVPKDPEEFSALIEAVPDSWWWVDGTLNAPSDLVHRHEAVAGSNLLVSRFDSIKPTYEGVRNGETNLPPDYMAMLVERKLPGKIRFDEAGYKITVGLTFPVVKRIALAYVKKGYRGDLWFFRDHNRRSDEKFDNSARLMIDLEGGGPHRFGLTSAQRIPHVEVRCMTKDESIECVAPLLEVCTTLKLQELANE